MNKIDPPGLLGVCPFLLGVGAGDFILGFFLGPGEGAENLADTVGHQRYQNLLKEQLELVEEAKSEECTVSRKGEISSRLSQINGELQSIKAEVSGRTLREILGGASGYSPVILVVGGAVCSAI